MTKSWCTRKSPPCWVVCCRHGVAVNCSGELKKGLFDRQKQFFGRPFEEITVFASRSTIIIRQIIPRGRERPGGRQYRTSQSPKFSPQRRGREITESIETNEFENICCSRDLSDGSSLAYFSSPPSIIFFFVTFPKIRRKFQPPRRGKHRLRNSLAPRGVAFSRKIMPQRT